MDPFLLGEDVAAASVAAQVARYAPGGQACELQLCAADAWPLSMPAHRGPLLLVRTPHEPQDVVRACQPLLTTLPGARGVVLLDPSPSLTASVLQKALEAAGMQHIARNTVILASGRGGTAGAKALLQLSEAGPAAAVPLPLTRSAGSGPAPRIAVARDAAFAPRFSEWVRPVQQLEAAGAGGRKG